MTSANVIDMSAHFVSARTLNDIARIRAIIDRTIGETQRKSSHAEELLARMEADLREQLPADCEFPEAG